MATTLHDNRFRVGDVTVTRIVEREGPWHDPCNMFPKATPEKVAEHRAALPDFAFDAATGMINLTFQSLLLRTPRHTILIDTCVGEHQDRREGLLYPKDRWLREFNEAGISFEDIDYVFCTHMHVDHVGWNTRLRDGRLVPTFPNARYIFGRREYEYWEEWNRLHGPHRSGPSFYDSVLPIVEAGRAELVEDDFEIDELIHLSPAPGHTPGQCCANLASAGATAVFAGDAMHHPLQIYEPDWSTTVCTDPGQAVASRRAILERLVDTDTLLVTAHFPGHTVGHVVDRGDGFGFRYL